MNVYNIVWADDEIDRLLTITTKRNLTAQNFKIIGIAHNGIELESVLNKLKRTDIDAVIIDANFNETNTTRRSEHDASGLYYARSLYRHQFKKEIPFFIFTGRDDDWLRNIYKDNLDFLEDFPRGKRWFSKTLANEFNDMLDAIKQAVDENNSISFIIRNQYASELDAANCIDDQTYDFIFDFLKRNHENTLTGITEPFVAVRRIIEKIFSRCQDLNLIPPISANMNKTAAYFFYGNYTNKNGTGDHEKIYEMLDTEIMPRPLACSLHYIVDIIQDALHNRPDLKWKVNEYFTKTNDVLLLCAVVNILMDIIKWFKGAAKEHNNPALNEKTLWKKVEKEEVKVVVDKAEKGAVEQEEPEELDEQMNNSSNAQFSMKLLFEKLHLKFQRLCQRTKMPYCDTRL